MQAFKRSRQEKPWETTPPWLGAAKAGHLNHHSRVKLGDSKEAE
ncbi:MAG: hypothetical protein O6826_03235 [Acidobacteria bacterium]|nr:hypothetical protein [Acidobacteriota bacterium]